ncbi:MAG TPA: hypothetical protein VFE16_06585 [Candidatus Cybelea sp.]|jgi:hypothetical protein|nr:hypothetical protein [Candidatus Cybelea sp.]
MRSSLVLAAFVALIPTSVPAQTPPASPSAMAFQGVTLGEPIAGLKQRLGDPVAVVTPPNVVIWRYLEGGGAIYLDVLVKKSVAASVTVVQRFPGAPYTDSKGASFGMSADQVRALLGTPAKVTTNADDGSIDLWYRAGDYAWIYEFYSDKLGFIQLIASPGIVQNFTPGPPVAPSDGTSLDRAIWIRPSNPLSNTNWIDAYLATNECGTNGHWKQLSLKLKDDPPIRDPLAFTIVHARCTDGAGERDFYFDTHGQPNPASSSPTPGATPPLVPLPTTRQRP